VIKGLWTTPEFSHQGEHYQVNRATLVPPPVQQPHPPVYLAATRTEATLDFVAGTGFPLIVGVVQDTPEALALCHRFVELSGDAGHNVPMSEIPFFRYFHVGKTEEEARRDSREAVNWVQDMTQWRRQFPEGSEVHHHLEDWRRTRTELPPTYDYIYENRAIIGSPEKCIAKIKALQKEGIEYLGCTFSMGGMEHGKLMRSMELFAKEVMPHFA